LLDRCSQPSPHGHEPDAVSGMLHRLAWGPSGQEGEPGGAGHGPGPNKPVVEAEEVSSSQPATPSTWPSELVAVSARSPRAVASLEPGAITCAISIATTRFRGIVKLSNQTRIWGDAFSWTPRSYVTHEADVIGDRAHFAQLDNAHSRSWRRTPTASPTTAYRPRCTATHPSRRRWTPPNLPWTTTGTSTTLPRTAWTKVESRMFGWSSRQTEMTTNSPLGESRSELP